MKLVIVYGPPAVGKLTVAKELAALTGYKLFHNHLTVDVVASLFEFGSPVFWDQVRLMRELLFEAAAKNNVNMIFTFVYAAGEDDKIINNYINIIEKHSGEVCLVQLKASMEVLKKRIIKRNRTQYEKMTKTNELEKWVDKYNLFSQIPDRESLIIDNSSLSPSEVARQIIAHFQLK